MLGENKWERVVDVDEKDEKGKKGSHSRGTAGPKE